MENTEDLSPVSEAKRQRRLCLGPGMVIYGCKWISVLFSELLQRDRANSMISETPPEQGQCDFAGFRLKIKDLGPCRAFKFGDEQPTARRRKSSVRLLAQGPEE